jgi:hypothetical protein
MMTGLIYLWATKYKDGLKVWTSLTAESLRSSNVIWRFLFGPFSNLRRDIPLLIIEIPFSLESGIVRSFKSGLYFPEIKSKEEILKVVIGILESRFFVTRYWKL